MIIKIIAWYNTMINRLEGSAYLLCFLLCCCQQAAAKRIANKDSLIRAVQKTTSDTDKVNLELQLAGAFKPDSVPKEFFYANEALSLAEKTGYTQGVVQAEELLGECDIAILAYDDALAHFKQSITNAAKTGNIFIQRVDLQYIVHCYHMLNRLNEAADCQKQLLGLWEQTNDWPEICNQMTAYAQRLADLRKYTEAISCLKNSIILASNHLPGQQSKELQANMYNVLGLTYIKTNHTDSALAALRQGAAATKDRILAAYITSSFCDVYLAAQQYDSALHYALISFNEGKNLHDITLLQQYAAALSQLYTKANRPADALLYHLCSDSLLGVINNTRQTIDQALQVTKINIAQQAEHNRLEQAAAEAKQKNQQFFLIAAAIIILALSIVALLIYKNLRQKQKANRIIGLQAAHLQAQKELLDRALKGKQIMLEETHHRIKNNLQLISSLLDLQAMETEEQATKSALHNAQKRIQSIAAAHNALSDYGVGFIEFSSFADNLFARLSNAFSNHNKHIIFKNEIPETSLPLNTVVLLGLVLNELLTNSFKHAFGNIAAPEVHITLSVIQSCYTLTYSDNGHGLPEGTFEASSKSLGLYLVKRISKQLKGNASYNIAQNKFTISFQYAAE